MNIEKMYWKITFKFNGFLNRLMYRFSQPHRFRERYFGSRINKIDYNQFPFTFKIYGRWWVVSYPGVMNAHSLIYFLSDPSFHLVISKIRRFWHVQKTTIIINERTLSIRFLSNPSFHQLSKHGTFFIRL